MKRQEGFILTFVIVALIVVGVAMFVLTGGSNAMLFHADTAHAQAIERNLTASGLAWAQAQVAGDWDPNDRRSYELDTTGFSAPDVRLTLRRLESQGGRTRVRLETICHKGRRTLKRSHDFTLETP